jgi:hypothetical protein
MERALAREHTRDAGDVSARHHPGLPKLRTWIDLALIVLCAVVLVSRIRSIRSEPRIGQSARVVQLMYNRMLAQRVLAYAERYRRPAFELDSVVAHLDPEDAQLVTRLRTDLWGHRVMYNWSWCGFGFMSDAGEPQPWPSSAFDSAWKDANAHGRWRMPYHINEEYSWPRGVGRTYNCGGGP